MSLNYDKILGKTESLRYLNRCREEIKKLKKTTHFDHDELQYIFLIHFKVASSRKHFNKHLFNEFCHTTLGITDDTHYQNLFEKFDPKFNHSISLENWAENLSIMLRGSLLQQIDFVWQIYSNDNYINKEFIFACLKKTIIKEKENSDCDLLVKDIAGILLKKLDNDLDGKIGYDDYRSSVMSNVLLLECLGQCLPKPEASAAFLATFSNKPIRVRVIPESMYADDIFKVLPNPLTRFQNY